MIEAWNVSAGYAGKTVIQGISMGFSPGQVTVLLGPNGSGKSTFLKTALGLLPFSDGKVLYDGVDIRTMKPRDIARKAAFLTQSRNTPSILALRMVLHGRFPYLSYPRRYTEGDLAIARNAMDRTGSRPHENTNVMSLSGGERQGVYLAMALAQDTQTILMDEPTTYLDIQHQLDLLAFSQAMAREGRAVVLVRHDLCLALRFAHRGAVLSEGRLLQTGTPEELFSSGILTETFRTPLNRIRTEGSWRYYYD